MGGTLTFCSSSSAIAVMYCSTEVFIPEEDSLILAYRNVEILDFKWVFY